MQNGLEPQGNSKGGHTEDPSLPPADLSVPYETTLHLDELVLEEDLEAKVRQVSSMELLINQNRTMSDKCKQEVSSSMPSPHTKQTELKQLLTELQNESVAAAIQQERFFKQLIDRQKRLEMLLMNGDGHSLNRPSKVSEQTSHCSHASSIPSHNALNLSLVPRAVVAVPSSGGESKRSSRNSKAPSSNCTTQWRSEHWKPVEVPFKSSTKRSTLNNALGYGSWQSSEAESYHSFASCIERFLHRKEFEYGTAGAIMINALVMCFECQYHGMDVGYDLQYPGHKQQAQDAWSGAETAFTLFDWFFGLFFLLEMLVKLMCWRCKYFYNNRGWDADDWDLNDWILLFPRCMWSWQGWNILDALCVLAFLVDKVATLGSSNTNLLRILRLFRLFRLVRLLRFLEHLDHLYIMTTAISGLTRVLTWAIVLLTMLLLTCDLLLVQILHASYFNGVVADDLSEDQQKRYHEMFEYFGTSTRCMLSMYEITLGNWPPVARLLSEEVSEWFTLACLAHKLTIGFAVIGVITGVILQETFKVAQTDDLIMFRQKKVASSTLRKKMKTLFEALDQEGDGRLSEEEFTAIGDFPEIQCWLASLDIETDDLKTLFELIDVDHSGFITLDELVGRIPRIKGHARSIDMLAIRRQTAPAIQEPSRRRTTISRQS